MDTLTSLVEARKGNMAEEEKKDSGETPEENIKKQSSEEKLLAGKYKSAEELEKAYLEEQSKIQEQGTRLNQQAEELGQLREFQSKTYPIIDAVYADQELMGKVRQAVDAKYGVPVEGNTETEKEEQPKVDPRAMATESFLRQQAISNFKARHGLDKLSMDDGKSVDEALMNTMARWIIPGQPIPLEKVDALLEDAYKIVRNDKLIEDKVFESLAEQRTNQQATVGQLSAGSPGEKSPIELSEEERSFARKLGVKEEDALEYKKRQAEGNFESIIK